MNSMSDTTAVKSDQINAADLLGGSITVTVSGVKIDLSSDQPVSMQLKETPKVFRPCKIMRRAIMEMWGNDANAYVGRSMTLYCDPNVRFGKDQPGGTRISHMSHIDGERVVTTMVSKGKFAPHHIRPLVQNRPALDQVATAVSTAAPDHTALAMGIACRGTDAFRAWWKSDEGKSARASGVTATEDIKRACADADAAIAADPFGLPPIDNRPAPEQMAPAEAAAFATASDPDQR